MNKSNSNDSESSSSSSSGSSGSDSDDAGSDGGEDRGSCRSHYWTLAVFIAASLVLIGLSKNQ